MVKLYTKSGDDGFTSLGNGKRISKSSEVIELYGALDELNVFLSYAGEFLHADLRFEQIFKRLLRIQRELFELTAHLASGNKFTLNPHKVGELEFEIDQMSESLPVLNSFILPSGGEAAIRIHMGRVVCRRAERSAFKLDASKDNATVIGIYLNRLSDWLYAAARSVAKISNIEEVQVSFSKK